MEDNTFAEGSVIQLEKDDASSTPRFILITGKCFFSMNNNTAYETFLNLEKLEGRYDH